jgi:hypothetical protein
MGGKKSQVDYSFKKKSIPIAITLALSIHNKHNFIPKSGGGKVKFIIPKPVFILLIV